MIAGIEEYFDKGCGRCDRFDTPACSTKRWAAGIEELRRLCLNAGLEECVKWGHPVYMHAGRNIAIIGAFQGNFRLGFFEPGLLKDPDGILVRQGPNSAYPDTIRFDDNGQVAESSKSIGTYLREAMGYAEEGRKQPKIQRDIELPEELVEVLDADPELAEAFHALTPGRKRSYAIAIGGAKKSETRYARVEKLHPKILAGKGANEY